jgi:hypothetical protein
MSLQTDNVALLDLLKVLPKLSEQEMRQVLFELDTLETMKAKELQRDKFLKFVEAPVRAGEPFELATEILDEHAHKRFLANRCQSDSEERIGVGIHAVTLVGLVRSLGPLFLCRPRGLSPAPWRCD